MANSVKVNFELERSTKNKVRYKGPDDFGVLYVPKSWFGENEPPAALSIEATW